MGQLLISYKYYIHTRYPSVLLPLLTKKNLTVGILLDFIVGHNIYIIFTNQIQLR